MKCQSLFSDKNKNIINLSSAELVQRETKIKNTEISFVEDWVYKNHLDGIYLRIIIIIKTIKIQNHRKRTM